MAEQDQASSEAQAHGTAPSREPKRVLHRVCIQCNNMFQVTPDNFGAKQCPNCHKG